MDLNLFARVLWRSRLLVVFGFLLAVVVATYAVARPTTKGGLPTLTWRDPVLSQSSVELLVTQRGFPEGRSSVGSTSGSNQSNYTDPSRFSDLSVLYAQLVAGNAVQRRIFGPTTRPSGLVFAEPLQAPGGSGYLPVLVITGVTSSPAGAAALADRSARSFTNYLVEQQQSTGTPASQRVLLERVLGPTRPRIYQARKMTKSIFAFVVLLLLTVGAAFVRENIRKQQQQQALVETGGESASVPRAVEPVEPVEPAETPTAARQQNALQGSRRH